MGRQEQAETAPARAGTDERALYERMVLIRRFEETLLELFAAGELHGTTHTYIGQEADAVGVITCLEPERRRHRLEPPLPRPLPRLHRRRRRPAPRGDGPRRRGLRRQGWQPAPLRGQLLLERRARQHGAARGGDGPRRAREGPRRGRNASSSGTARSARASSTRASTSPRSGGSRSSSSSSTTAMRSRRRPACSWPATSRRAPARSGSRRPARHDRRPRGARGGERGGRPRPLDGHAVLSRARHVPLQSALEGRRLPRPRGDRPRGGCATR